MNFPKEYSDDIDKGIQILKQAGATEIFIFGSLADTGRAETASDIDIAARGIPKSKFFEVYGLLLTSLEHQVDLVCLDYNTPFAELLIEKGTLYRVA
jgi:predicted nucleotidyltransferase